MNDKLYATSRHPPRHTILTRPQLSALKEEIRRLERNNLRGSANLEYLKNVLVIFLENTATRDKYVRLIAVFHVQFLLIV